MAQVQLFLCVFLATLWAGDILLTLCAIKAERAAQKRTMLNARIAKVLRH